MARLGLTLLGGFQAGLDPGGAVALPTKKAQALLAYLALPLGQAHPRDKLAALLWGGIREESARNSLRQALFTLRKALATTAPPSLTLDRDTIALDRGGVSVDVADFERLLADGAPEALARARSTRAISWRDWRSTSRRSRSGCWANASGCGSSPSRPSRGCWHTSARRAPSRRRC
jgi:DNA-binding SARP family transcriptional activator